MNRFSRVYLQITRNTTNLHSTYMSTKVLTSRIFSRSIISLLLFSTMSANVSFSTSSSTLTLNSLPGGRPINRTTMSHKQREGAGFIVTRPFPSRNLDHVGGTFLMLDHLGPTNYKPGEAVGAPDHPHAGFTTLTYILEGEMEHKDSFGTTDYLGGKNGGAQYMCAGSGIIHSEMPTEAYQKRGGVMHGFQLWINLRKEHKFTKAFYQNVANDDMPITAVPNSKHDQSISSVRVLVGEYNGVKAKLQPLTNFSVFDIRLGPTDSVSPPIPNNQIGFVYVYQGKGLFGPNLGTSGSVGNMVELGKPSTIDSNTTPFHISAPSDSELRCLLIYGEPIDEPIARYGPFVMNTQEQLKDCFIKYQNGVFGTIEGAEERQAATKEAIKTQKSAGTWQKDNKDL